MICPFCNETILGTPNKCYKCGGSISEYNEKELQKQKIIEQEKLLKKQQIEQEKKQKQYEIEKNIVNDKYKLIIQEQKEKSDYLKSVGYIDNLKTLGYDEYYEYTILDICDNNYGRINTQELISKMNSLALEGWRLVTAFTNELGKNTSQTCYCLSSTF